MRPPREERPWGPGRGAGPRPREREFEEAELEAVEERPARVRERVAFEEREVAEVAELPPPRPISGVEFAALVERLRTAAEEVHRGLGAGLHELAYQRALGLELTENRIPYLREVKVPVFYKGRQIDTRSVDFLIESVHVEIKARSAFERADQVQATSYLRASGYERGVLVNFGEQVELHVLGEPPTVAPAAAEPAAAIGEQPPKRRRTTRRKAEGEEEMP